MFETREQVLEKIMAQTKPSCPHCGEEMNLWEVPPINVGDGLGWGAPFLFLCFNDDCPLYQDGWDHMKENYAHTASYRCMNYPGTEQYELIPVFSDQGGRAQIIDEQALADHQLKGLQWTVGHAFEGSGFYRERLEAFRARQTREVLARPDPRDPST